MLNEKLYDIKKRIKESPQLTDDEFAAIMSPRNDEQIIDNLKFDEKNYNILDHIVINPK